MRSTIEVPDLHIIATNTALISLATLSNYLLEETLLLTLVALLAMADTVVGVWAAYALGKNPSSRQFKLGIFAKGSILVLLGSITLVLKAFYIDNAREILNWFFWAFCISESFSIVGNTYTIWTKQPNGESLITTKVIKKVKQLLEVLWGESNK